MADFDAILKNATAGNNVPFVVAMHGDSKGVNWSGASGNRADGAAAAQDTVFRIFSMTKAIGSTAAMILADRGKLDLDATVESIIPDFAKLQVLEGFDGDTPILRAPKTKATVRHLATHTSGLVYEFWNGDVAKYLEVTETPGTLSGDMKSLSYPLMFDPGERWDYGTGIDWLGQVVEAVDGRKIDQFCREEIFEPLGMSSTAFELSDDMKSRLAQVYARGEDGNFADFPLELTSNPGYYGMGHAMYSTAPDYMNFIRMYLNKGELNGNRVLSEDAVEKMLANSIGDIRVGKMTTHMPALTADVDLFPGTDKTHSFGFLRVESDVPGMRSAASQGWAGICNTHFWFDPEKDVAGLIMTQTLPFVEKPYMELYEAFERAVYSEQ